MVSQQSASVLWLIAGISSYPAWAIWTGMVEQRRDLAGEAPVSKLGQRTPPPDEIAPQS